MSNYNHDDVADLNAWAIQADACIDRLTRERNELSTQAQHAQQDIRDAHAAMDVAGFPRLQPSNLPYSLVGRVRVGTRVGERVDAPSDGVWEALQRLIENAETLGPASKEDALLVARWRGQFVAARERLSAPAEPAMRSVPWQFFIDMDSYLRHIECFGSAGGKLVAEEIRKLGNQWLSASPADAAKAPTLLEACKKAEEWLSGWASAEPYLSVIRAAIANATDPQPAKAADSPFTASEIEANPRLYIEPERWERRHDGKVVRRDRWEWGVRNIVTALVGPRTEFEIEDIVAQVRELAASRPVSPALTDAQRLQIIEALEAASNGLQFYRDRCPDAVDGSDDEADEMIAAAIGTLHLLSPAKAAPKLWLWKNFVDGKPEYWAFDNPYPTNLDNADPMTLGEPCGYAIFKPSRQGRTDVSEAQVLRAIARATATQPEPRIPMPQALYDEFGKEVTDKVQDFVREHILADRSPRAAVVQASEPIEHCSYPTGDCVFLCKKERE